MGYEVRKSMSETVKEIMFEKLKEMAELNIDDFEEEEAYNSCCSVLNDIAQALLRS